MARKRRRQSRRPETMRRNAVISSFRPSISFSVRGESKPEPEIEGRAWLRLRGMLIEPIRDVHEVTLSLWPDPDKRVGPPDPSQLPT